MGDQHHPPAALPPDKKHGTHFKNLGWSIWVQENRSPTDFELLPSSPKAVVIPAAAENMKKVTLQIHPKFRVICGKFISAKQERIFSALLWKGSICDYVYGNLNSNPFLGHLNLDQSIALYLKSVLILSCVYS